MKNVINFLEKMGARSDLKNLEGDLLQKVLNPLDLDETIQSAIVLRDNAALEELLGVRNKIVCAICPAEEPTKEPSDDEQEQDDDEEKALVGNGW